MRGAEEFRAALAGGEFMINRCRRCSAASSPDAAVCHSCGSREIEWVPASGDASVISWSRTPMRNSDSGSDSAPIVVIAQLAEGPWWWGALDGVALERLRVGARLRLGSTTTPSGALVPRFSLVTQAD